MTESASVGSIPVMADAQFGIGRILRPVDTFQATYTGRSAASPIYMFDTGGNLDQLAADRVAGYDRTLARGIPVPIGSRVVLLIPNIFWIETGPIARGYEWVFIWRWRSLADYRRSRKLPFQLAKQGTGPDDTTAPVGQRERVVIPAAYNTVVFNQTEPTAELARAVQHAHSEDIEFATVTLPGPLLPDGTEQAVEQGILNPAVVTDAIRPQFLVHEMQALGNELLIAIKRDVAVDANWNFATVDLRLAQFLGNATGQTFPDVGVYVCTGSAP